MLKFSSELNHYASIRAENVCAIQTLHFYNITIASSLNEDSRVHWCSWMLRCLHIVFWAPAAVKLWAARNTSDTLHIPLELIFHHYVFRNPSLLPVFEAPTFSYTISHGRWDPRFQNLGSRCEGILKLPFQDEKISKCTEPWIYLTLK